MYNIGDKLVYGSGGVMTVVDIREETVIDTTRRYYVLQSLSGHGDSLTFVPVDNDKLVGAMRSLITKEEAYKIIDTMDEIPEVEWIKDNRARADGFKKILESASPRDIIAMIKAIDSSAKRRLDEGKKNFLADENIMRKAERAISEELSVVFGISEEEVSALVENRKARK